MEWTQGKVTTKKKPQTTPTTKQKNKNTEIYMGSGPHFLSQWNNLQFKEKLECYFCRNLHE